MREHVKRYWPVAGIALALFVGLAIGRSWRMDAAAPGIDVGEEIGQVLQLPRGVERTGRLVEVLRAMDEEDALVVAEALEADLSALSAFEIRLFAGQWATLAPGAAFDRVVEWPDEDVARVAGGAEVLEVWARAQPLEAMHGFYAHATTMGKAKGEFATAIAQGWLDSGVEPEGLGPFLSQLTDWDRERATRIVMDRLCQRSPREAMRFAESIPRGAPNRFRNLVFRKVALVVGASDPVAVADWLEPQRDTRYGQAGIRVLARTWAGSDPEAAMSWAVQQPDDRARFLAIKFGFERWYDDDRKGALAWLDGVDAPGMADPAYLMLALLERGKTPARAAEAALRIDDGKLREETLGKVLNPWLRRAPAEAREWIASSDLPEDQRAIWLQLTPPDSRSPTDQQGTGSGSRSAAGGPT